MALLRGRLSQPGFTGILMAAVVVLGVAGCGPSNPERQDLVSGSFNGGRLIGMDTWVGGNSTGTNLDAYAEVPDQSAAVLDLSGPEHWRCPGVLKRHAPVASGTFLESSADRLKDRVLNLPSFLATGEANPGIEFGGPAGTYRVTLEVPSVSAKYGHSWKLGSGAWNPITKLYDNPPACRQVADTTSGQRSLGDRYLYALQQVLDRAMATPAEVRLRALLDQAKREKASGDARTDDEARASDYRSAAATLLTLAQSVPASGDQGLYRNGVFDLVRLATNGASILSQTGLH